MRSSLLALSLVALLTPAALAVEPEAMDPVEVLHRLRGRGAPEEARAVKSLEDVMALTGHSRDKIAWLLELEAKCTGERFSFPTVSVATVTSSAPALRPGVRAWDDLPAGVTLQACFADAGLEVVLAREAPGAALHVAFPPGLLARAERGDGQRSAQDLAILAAGELALGAGELQARLWLPAACAGYGWSGPREGQPYALERLPASSRTARLLHAVAALNLTEVTPEAQLAVWAVRDGIRTVRWSDTSTFTGRGVDPEHAEGAARLIGAAGVDPASLPLFAAEPTAP